MQFRDLQKQYEVLKPEMDAAMIAVASGAHFISGEQVKTLEERLAYLRNLTERKESVKASIAEQEKLTDELAAAIDAAQTLAELLRGVLPLMPDASVLVVGLGNRAITPDAVGPDAIDSVMVTRHLREQLPEHFGQFRPVAALAAGVLGTTGVESADMIRALAAHLHPDAIIAVDALACAELDRLGRTVQLTDTGITPGSGVGNDRAGLSRDTLGIPVAAIGLPTVIDAGGFSDDPRAEQMFVTPRDIDTVVRDAAKLIGYGINLALHDGLTIGDVDMFLS